MKEKGNWCEMLTRGKVEPDLVENMPEMQLSDYRSLRIMCHPRAIHEVDRSEFVET